MSALFKRGKQNLGGNAATAQQFYKWQDEQGQWHFSDEKPTANSSGNPVQQVRINTNTNIIQSVSTPKAAPKVQQQQTDVVPSVIATPTQAMKALEQARQVQGLMDNRQRQLEQALDR